jgi:hypothetical protein
MYNLPRVSGIMRPFPDQATTGYLNLGLTLNDVNSEAYRQQIINACKFLVDSCFLLFLFVFFQISSRALEPVVLRTM